MQEVEYQGWRWHEPVRTNHPSSSRTDLSRTSPVRLAQRKHWGMVQHQRYLPLSPVFCLTPTRLELGGHRVKQRGHLPFLPHVATLQPLPPPSAKLLNNSGPRNLLIPSLHPLHHLPPLLPPLLPRIMQFIQRLRPLRRPPIYTRTLCCIPSPAVMP